MLTIIEIQARPDGGHGLESQSHRTENWMGEGCELVIEDGKLVDLIPGEIPPPPESPPTDTEVLNALLGVSENE